MPLSKAFALFLEQAPAQAAAWMTMVEGMAKASALDPKTEAIAYLAVLAATGQHSGISFHVAEAKRAGASREEVVSAILLGLPAVGHRAVGALPDALAAYDGPDGQPAP